MATITLLDRIEIRIPKDAPLGTYRLGTGFYDTWSRERLSVESEVASIDHAVLTLGEIDVASDE